MPSASADAYTQGLSAVPARQAELLEPAGSPSPDHAAWAQARNSSLQSDISTDTIIGSHVASLHIYGRQRSLPGWIGRLSNILGTARQSCRMQRACDSGSTAALHTCLYVSCTSWVAPLSTSVRLYQTLHTTPLRVSTHLPIYVIFMIELTDIYIMQRYISSRNAAVICLPARFRRGQV